MPTPVTRRRAAAVAALALTVAALPALPALPAAAHGGDRDARRATATGTPVPVLASPNVRLVTTVPTTSPISGVFADSAPIFVVSSLDSIDVFDVADPRRPRLVGTLPNALFENEAISYGEQRRGGTVTRFVLLGVDGAEYSPTDPSHVATGKELVVVDVTDPARPYLRSRVGNVSTSTHTVTCVPQGDCRYAYTAGTGGRFSVIDLTDLDRPREVRVVASPASGPNAVFTRGAGHKWNLDGAGYAWHTGSGGTAVFDVRDPGHPIPVQATNAAGLTGPWNDFIHHNSYRPQADRFRPGAPPSLANGNVVLVTEEDYENTDCATAGSLQTWYVPDLDGPAYRTANPTLVPGRGSIRPLDRINPVALGGGLSLPREAFCLAHWFDYHPSGIVAQGYYQGGLRLVDVRDPAHLRQYGYFTTGASEVWDAYWVPQRDRRGRVNGEPSNLVYVVDTVRGLDVVEVDLPAGGDGDRSDGLDDQRVTRAERLR